MTVVERATFGDLVVETDIDDAVIETLRRWLPTYLAQAERERTMTVGTLARPHEGSYLTVLDDDEFPDAALPAVIATTGATADEPERDGNGLHYGAWDVTVSAIVRGRTKTEARRNAALYGGSVRRLLVQQGLALAGEVRWAASRVAPVTDSSGRDRQLAAAVNAFVVYVDGVLSDGTGPTIPAPTPQDTYEELATVTAVSTQIDGRS